MYGIVKQAGGTIDLLSEVGVGTIAAGVAKGRADEILISGHDGGTGASPLSSVWHAGIPWEMGLAETQQTLVANGLRDRVLLQTDGQLKTGRDVIVAALLGAERFGFGTAALVSLGCLMVRQCHHGTCPVGIATQEPALRKRFIGQPEHLERYLLFVAREAREWMAKLGFRCFDELIGRADLLRPDPDVKHWKAQTVDLSRVLVRAVPPEGAARRRVHRQPDTTRGHVDWALIEAAEPAIERKERVVIERAIRNTDRTIGTILSNRIIKRYGAEGLPDDTIRVGLQGSAGQSFGAFLAPGVTLHLVGDANDYLGKGLSGGRVIVQTPPDAHFPQRDNVIVGNTLLYGATSGEVFINGLAGERFAVRNSGAVAVVEGLGDHGCEYMTGGTVVVLGSTGRNFGAGMNGGTAYVLDEHQLFDTCCNLDMIDLEPLWQEEDLSALNDLIVRHHQWTGSSQARWILDTWRETAGKFVKVVPLDYRRALARLREAEETQADSATATEEVFHG